MRVFRLDFKYVQVYVILILFIVIVSSSILAFSNAFIFG